MNPDQSKGNVFNFCRKVAIHHICTFKLRCQHLMRQTQFIAFSIIDQLNKQFMETKLQITCSQAIYAAASILLASKLNDVKSLNIEMILAYMPDLLDRNQILQSELSILKVLNYNIPFQNAYSELVCRIKMEPLRTCFEMQKQCLKLLLLTVKQYQNVVSDIKLGVQILDLVCIKKCSPRLKNIVRGIQLRQKDKKQA